MKQHMQNSIKSYKKLFNTHNVSFDEFGNDLSYIDHLDIELSKSDHYFENNFNYSDKDKLFELTNIYSPFLYNPYDDEINAQSHIDVIKFKRSEFIKQSSISAYIERHTDIIKNIYLHIELDMPFYELSELEKQKIFDSVILIKMGLNDNPVFKKLSDLVLLTNIMDKSSIQKDNIIQLCLINFEFVKHNFDDVKIYGLPFYTCYSPQIHISTHSAYINTSSNCLILIDGLILKTSFYKKLGQNCSSGFSGTFLDSVQNYSAFNTKTIDDGLANNCISIRNINALTNAIIFNLSYKNTNNISDDSDTHIDKPYINMIKILYHSDTNQILEKTFEIEDLITIDLYNNKYHILPLLDDYNTIEKMQVNKFAF